MIPLQVVDPWGCVVAQCREGTDVATAEIDLAYVAKLREEMPVWQHRRHDLYSQVFSLACTTGQSHSHIVLARFKSSSLEKEADF